jgi:exodeoxyribonuclease V alpha subunit
MNTSDQLTGIVERIIYNNAENGFTVFVLLSHQKPIIATGSFPTIHAGQQITVNGVWITHTQFGRQFNVQSCTLSIPTSIDGIKKYLGSGLIKGIGPAYAEKLVNYFGAEVLDIIDQHPQRLNEVSGIGPKRVEKITLAWQDQKEVANVMVFLQEKDVSPAYAAKIYKYYGKESIAVITQNPYKLADDIWGIGFKTADKIAHNLGISHYSNKRICAGIIFTIQEHMGSGNLYIPLENLRQKTIELLELNRQEQNTHDTIRSSLYTLYNEEKIKLITKNNIHFITLTQYYFCEKGVAQKIRILCAQKPFNIKNVNTISQSLMVPETNENVHLNDEQQEAIISCLKNKITIITGGPGTGKTTVIKKLLTILEQQQLHYVLCAPTGRAAKRITQSTGRLAVTMHRLLEFDVSTFSFLKNEKNAIRANIIIIDEASMIDIFLAHALLKATPLDAHVVFIGDVYQLPSVSAGNFLNDLINSNIVACTRLNKIFRQSEDSMIIVNAHRINNGNFPLASQPNTKNDYIFIKELDPCNINKHLQTIFHSTLSQAGISANNTIVLTPMNRGIVGTHTLNHMLQEILNKTDTEKHLTYSGTVFKVGDRVMQIRNNYDKNIFNGDIGHIEDINTEDNGLLVRFDHDLVEYEKIELDELVLAYAISVHKSQGSEFSAVIIPLFMQHFTLLQRNLLYTAVTRAKQLCIIIGQPKAIAIAVKNNKNIERITFLQDFLTTDLACKT